MHPVLTPAALLAASLLAATPPASANPLTALTDRSHILGWEAVGRLDLGGSGFCSASLVAPDTVLTAAHCLMGPDGAPIDPTEVTFQAGLRDGAAIAKSAVARAVVPEAFRRASKGSVAYVRHDVALLILAEPIPAATAAFFPVAESAGEGREVTVLSYGRGRANAMSREIDCTTLGAGQGILAFDCHANPGSSGAPVFDMSGRSPRIVSIVSGGGVFDGRKMTFGMDLAPVVAELREALRTGRGVWPADAAPVHRTIGLTDRSAGAARFVRP